MAEHNSGMKNEINSIDPLFKYRQASQKATETAAADLKIKTLPPMEIPPTSELGDFAYPCFSLAKELKRSPQKVAEMLHSNLGTIDMMEVFAVNGYLNFKIDLKALSADTVPLILKTKNDYGSYPRRPEKVILEHTSANPNGPFHVGRARNPIIGDTLARILRRAGFPVEVQYWVNDMGKQVAILSWGIQNIKEENLQPITTSKKDHLLVRFYQAAYKKMEEDPGVEKIITQLIQAYERGDKDELGKLRKPIEDLLEGMVESLNKLNIYVDKFVMESEGVLNGTVDEIITKLKQSSITREEDGAFYLDLEEYDIAGKTARFVYTRGDGTSLYTTRDLAYHLNKLQNCDIAINILGEDHKLQSKQLEIALRILGLKNVPEVVFYSFVSLEEGKMSTRKGNVVYLDDLMEEAVLRASKEVETRRPELSDDEKAGIAETVGLGAIRYNIIRVQPEKKITFKWKDALNFEGASAPFIQYSHARACSILRKAVEGSSEDTSNGSTSYEDMIGGYKSELLTEPSEEGLIRNLAKLPSLIHECAVTRKPHPIATYAYKTAALFNQFYKDCPVLLAEPPGLRNSRLALVNASKWCLAGSLELLGINAPEQM
jgi:arginyl-tRNA synthetase